jgi:hypothetical protein
MVLLGNDQTGPMRICQKGFLAELVLGHRPLVLNKWNRLAVRDVEVHSVCRSLIPIILYMRIDMETGKYIQKKH